MIWSFILPPDRTRVSWQVDISVTSGRNLLPSWKGSATSKESVLSQPYGKINNKCRPFADFGFDCYQAFVSLDNGIRYRKAEP